MNENMTDAEIIDELKREPAAELRRLQRMPYEWKVEHALDVIREFVEHEGENGVYVSFSGGKDSLVLLHLVRSIYPDVPAVFANTGIEFPEQVKFVRSFPNVTEVHPIKHFPKIIKEDGIVYPSKEVAMYIKAAKGGATYAVNGLKGLDTDGKENRYKARFKKWAYLMDCGVKISPDCCELMKERPMRDYEKSNGKSPIIGTRAEESFRRAVGWMKSGCNSFAGKRAKSTPLSLWVESDVLRYIDENGIKLSPMYTEGGMKRTGCMFCPVPIAHGDLTNIEYVRTNHPKIYETMMIKHGLKAMLDKVRNTTDRRTYSARQRMTDQLSLLPMLDDAEHPTWLLNGKQGIQNDSGVYVENVFIFREGNLSGVNIEVELCAEGNFILFDFSYQTGTYGSGSPLCRPCHECHRANSAQFLAECIYNVFHHGVVPYDKNLVNYPKETKELLKLCKKACERIAKEVA